MADLTIKTNNASRDVLRWYDLTARERAEFDYIDTEEQQAESSFVRYKDEVYDLGEFQAIQTREHWPEEMRKWHGYRNDSYFSGIVIRYASNDCESVIMGTFYS